MRTKQFSIAGLAMLGLLPCLGMIAKAEERPKATVEAKIRMGYGLTDPDKLGNQMYGVSFGGYFQAGPGEMIYEAGFQWKEGRQYLESLRPRAAGTVAPRSYADSRRNAMGGAFGRLGYRMPMGNEFHLQGGLQLGGAQFKHEYAGNIIAPWDDNLGDFSYQDFYYGTPKNSALGLSPFAGVRLDFSPTTSFECNLVHQTYTSLNFVHTPGAALIGGDPNRPGSKLVYKGDALEEKARGVLHLEFAYVIRF